MQKGLPVPGLADLVRAVRPFQTRKGRVVQTPVAQEYEWEDNAASRAELLSDAKEEHGIYTCPF